MSIKITGVLKDALGKPISGCTIRLTAMTTSATVITTTRGDTLPDAAGSYSLDVEPGRYKVSLMIPGWPPEDVGRIEVTVNSQPGTLNDFLTRTQSGDLTLDIMSRFEQLAAQVAEEARQTAKDSHDADSRAGAAKTSETNAAASATASAESAAHSHSSETAAKASETRAEESATAAAVSQVAARSSEGNAKNSETAAAGSKTAAATSETHAAGSASAAHTSETNAAASATAAHTSETNAHASEQAAAGAATAAKSSEAKAELSATIAADSRQAAKASEDNAKISETAAAGSAQSAKEQADRALTANPDDQLKKAKNLTDVADPLMACANLMALSFRGNELFPNGIHNTQSAATLNAIGHMRDDIITDPGSIHGLHDMLGEGPLLTLRRDNIQRDITQLFFAIPADSKKSSVWFRAFLAGDDVVDDQLNTQDWYQLIGMNDVTVDTNGFLKKASPVIKLFSDGRFETNSESEGVTVTRQAKGRYLLEGCMGLNADAGWGGVDGGFEIPVDRNKQPRIWLDYEVNADGSIVIKTSHRTHPGAPLFAQNLIDGVNNGDAVDIPADSFVSVRVEMPADNVLNDKQP